MNKKIKNRLSIKTKYAKQNLQQIVLLQGYMLVYELIADYCRIKQYTDENEKYTKILDAFVRIEAPTCGIDLFSNLLTAYERGLITQAQIKKYLDTNSIVMVPSIYCSCVMTKKELKDAKTEDEKIIFQYLTEVFNGELIGFREDLPALPPSKVDLLSLNAKMNMVKKLYNEFWESLVKNRIDLHEVEDITLAQVLIQTLYLNSKRAVDVTTVGYLELDKTKEVLDNAIKLMHEIYNRTNKKISKQEGIH